MRINFIRATCEGETSDFTMDCTILGTFFYSVLKQKKDDTFFWVNKLRKVTLGTCHLSFCTCMGSHISSKFPSHDFQMGEVT